MPQRLALALATAAALALPAAHAQTVLLSDSFDAENGGAGAAEYSGFANWTAANVDLLAPGYFFNLCQAAGGTTPCLDLEGSGNGSLTTRVAYSFAAGLASVQFDLAGDQRRGGNSVTVSVTSLLGATLFSEVFALPIDAPFATVVRTFSVPAATTARLSFLSGGAADSFGLLLDNVVLTAGVPNGPGPVTPIPEPSTWALLGGGLAVLGTVARRRGARRSV
jgi:hypothetical protein